LGAAACQRSRRWLTSPCSITRCETSTRVTSPRRARQDPGGAEGRGDDAEEWAGDRPRGRVTAVELEPQA
jgi:hypothetical protein